MEKKKIKPLWLVISGLATIGLAYGIYLLAKKGEKKELFNFSKKSGNSNQVTIQNPEFPLRVGSSGEKVRKLQKYLNSKILPPRTLLVVDGKFGKKTSSALYNIEGVREVSQQKYSALISTLNPFI